MIECVTLENSHLFGGNPILEQHKLRYQSIIKRQNWDVPTIRGMEYDAYDNPAAYYLIKRDGTGKAIGSSRLYPTDRPYMLQEAFSHLAYETLPKAATVWEGSRFCVDASLPPAARRRVMQEIVIGYLEFALANGIEAIVGVMFPVYWKNVFTKAGWEVTWLGDVHKSDEGHKIVAGYLPVSAQVLAKVRETTGIYEPILSFGMQPEAIRAVA